MGVSVKVENLCVLFGPEKHKDQALKMIESGQSNGEIKKKLNITVANRNVNFDIKENELFVIVGLSGSGKSTFIRTLNLLNQPTAGRIIVGDENILDFDKDKLLHYRRNQVSMVFQHFGLLSHRTVIKNIEYPLEIQNIEPTERTNRALERIEKVGLKGWENAYINQLSGGMQQRVGLARAIINNPNLLLMDEPYSALDPLIRRQMQKELLDFDDDDERTIVFITHDMNEAFLIGDKIALMKDGEVIQVGKPEDFFNKPANQYVEDFIADVDKTRILKVRNVMRKDIHQFKSNDYVSDALNYMNEKEIQVIFVTEDNKLLGAVTKVSLENTKNKTLKTLIDNSLYKSVYRNAYLKDVMKELKDAKYDIPVIDIHGRLRGVLGYGDLVDALA